MSQGRNLSRFLRNFVTSDRCPFRMPWFRLDSDDKLLTELHALVYRIEWRLASKRERIAMCTRTILWPVVSILQAVQNLRRYGRFAKKRSGRSRIQQFLDLAYLANVRNLSPYYYYVLNMYMEKNRRRIDRYIPACEGAALMWHLLDGVTTQRLDNKVSFSESCREHGLRAAPVVAAFDGDTPPRWFPSYDGHLPEQSLFVKPIRLSSGTGAERWEYVFSEKSWTSRGRKMNEDQLLAYCKQCATHGGRMVQPLLKNHEGLASHSSGGLCTVRIVTCLPSGEEPTPILACLLMPQAGNIVSNWGAGGLEAPIRMLDGVIGPAIAGMTTRNLCEHPDTKSRIDGFRVPLWEDALALSLQAHRVFSESPFIGWDIAILDSGPILLESNTIWSFGSQGQDWLLDGDCFIRLYHRCLAAKERIGV